MPRHGCWVWRGGSKDLWLPYFAHRTPDLCPTHPLVGLFCLDLLPSPRFLTYRWSIGGQPWKTPIHPKSLFWSKVDSRAKCQVRHFMEILVSIGASCKAITRKVTLVLSGREARKYWRISDNLTTIALPHLHLELVYGWLLKAKWNQYFSVSCIQNILKVLFWSCTRERPWDTSKLEVCMRSRWIQHFTKLNGVLVKVWDYMECHSG